MEIDGGIGGEGVGSGRQAQRDIEVGTYRWENLGGEGNRQPSRCGVGGRHGGKRAGSASLNPDRHARRGEGEMAGGIRCRL